MRDDWYARDHRAPPSDAEEETRPKLAQESLDGPSCQVAEGYQVEDVLVDRPAPGVDEEGRRRERQREGENLEQEDAVLVVSKPL